MRAGILAAIGLALLAGLLWFASAGKPAAAPSAIAATGDLVYRSGTYSVRLTEKPCEDEELRGILEDIAVPPAKMYEITQVGKRSIGCWAYDMGGDVAAFSFGGGSGTIPIDWFRRE